MDPYAVLNERTAVEKVRDAIAAIVTVALPGFTVAAGRTDQDNIDDKDLPAVMIAVLSGNSGDGPQQGQLIHSPTIQFDCIAENSATLTIDQVNQRAMARIVRALHADPTLGGMVEDLVIVASDPSEQSAPDAGWAVLQMTTTYYTPSGDLFTIVGQSGEIF